MEQGNVIKSLSAADKHVVQVLTLKIAEHKGAEKAVSCGELVEFLGRKGYRVSEERVQDYIAYIRQKSFLRGLIGTARGFYLASKYGDLVERMRQIRQEYKELEELAREMQNACEISKYNL